HTAQITLLLEAIDERHQRARRYPEPAGQLPAALAAPAADGREGAKLAHRQLDVHQKPEKVIGECRLLASKGQHHRTEILLGRWRGFHRFGLIKWLDQCQSLDIIKRLGWGSNDAD